jgi:hypothetical protein
VHEEGADAAAKKADELFSPPVRVIIMSASSSASLENVMLSGSRILSGLMLSDGSDQGWFRCIPQGFRHEKA